MPLTQRQQKKAETRDALKRAASACFARLGYAATRVGDITAEAGTAAGTFYVHFPSKEALQDELLQEFNEALVGRLLPAWGAAGERVEDRLRAAAEAFLAHWEAHRGFVELYVQRAAQGMTLAQLRDGIAPEVAAAMIGALAEEARRRGATLPEPALVVSGLLALWARVGLQVLFNPAVDRAAAVDTLVRLTVGALHGVLEQPAEAT